MGAAATGFPLLPRGYTGGTITPPQANVVYSLLALIEAQIDPNAQGAGREITIQANTNILYVGPSANKSGPLSVTNCSYYLYPGSSRTYRASFPGNAAPVGDLYVLMANAANGFNVEIA